MKQYYLKISSNNEKSLKKILHFFFEHLKTKFNVIQKSISIKNNRKIITLLKSPHVNKTAQEHFEVHTFSKQILVKCFYLEKHFILLKKILNKLFTDISLSLKLVINKDIIKENKILVFYPDNFKLFSSNSFKTNYKRGKQKTKSKKLCLKRNSLYNLTYFLNTTSVFGESLIVLSKNQ